MKIKLFSIFALFALACGSASAADRIVVSVVGGRHPSTNRVVEQELDLASAGKLLGQPGEIKAEFVRVIEIGPAGEDRGTMISQVDPAAQAGRFVVCWQMPGELGAGKTRRFKVVLDGKGSAPVPAKPISAVSDEEKDGETVTVTNGPVELTYSKSAGGMITRATVNGVTGKFAWRDKIYDGKEYFLADHSADEIKLLASGPLRFAYETEGEYKNAGGSALSQPRAIYRFTQYAGEPIVRVEAKVAQDFAHEWVSLHFIEIHFDQDPDQAPPITDYFTDMASGALQQSGTGYPGKEWAAVCGDGLLAGVCDSQSLYIYDGGGPHYGAYARSGVAPWSSLSYPWRCGLFFGSGRGDIENLKKWSKIASDKPGLVVKLASLDQEIHALTGVLDKKAQDLEKSSGKDWIAGYIRSHVAQTRLKDAIWKMSVGELGTASDYLAQTKAALEDKAKDVSAKEKAGVLAGTANGYPFLANERVACFWGLPKDGCGLISIYDREKKREYLKADPQKALLWQMSVKKGSGGKGYSNVGKSCNVTPVEGGLKFRWDGGLGVTVHAKLAPVESFVRMRLTADAADADEGLTSVTFPAVDGILPITANGAEDEILDTWALGELRKSPIASGTGVQIEYPSGMQFTAMLAKGTGLYFSEEDPEANRKTLSWMPAEGGRGLAFNVSHPVLGGGGPGLVKKYASPGDTVLGPFHGDWYDAAQIYRKWALTAPWCAKGPIYERKDYPKWLGDAPYWTIGYLGTETEIEKQISIFDYYGIPIGICHAYEYFFPMTLDDRCPEYFPPKLGSENLKKVVSQMQAKGMRFVPYVNGWLWDQDTESYRTENAANQAGLMTSSGEVVVHTTYGYGQRLAGMCPGSRLWRKKLMDVSKELVGRYHFDGIYFDFLTIHTTDCFNREHGHPIAGGNFWTKSVRELYGQIRTELKKLRPDVMMTGEDNAEWVIDLLDTALSLGKVGTKAPLYQAVYHGYTLVYGGEANRSDPQVQGRWWLMGNQNGWYSIDQCYAKPPDEKWKKDGAYYRRLLQCHYKFGRPYLAYGRMLRPPKIEGNLPTVTAQSTYGPYTVLVVEGSAWQAPDGSMGIFFLNYSDKPQEFTWAVDLEEGAGWKKGQKVRLSRWTEEGGLKLVEDTNGGALMHAEKIDALGLIALKLEAAK